LGEELFWGWFAPGPFDSQDEPFDSQGEQKLACAKQGRPGLLRSKKDWFAGLKPGTYTRLLGRLGL